MYQPTIIVGLVVVWSASALGIDPPHTSVRHDLHGQPLPDSAVARLGDAHLRTARTREISFSYDGRFVARQRDTGLDIHEVATGRDVTPRHLIGLRGASFSFAPDGRHIVVETARERCRILDPQSGSVVFDLSTAGRHPWYAAMSRDGRTAFVRWYDGHGGAAMTLFDLSDATRPAGRDVLAGQQGAACLSADGAVLYAATEVGARAFETASGKELPRPPLQRLSHVTGVTLSPDGKTLVASHADNLRLYPVSEAGIGEAVTLPPVDLRGGMAWVNNGRELLVSCRDAVIRLDGKTGHVLGQSQPEEETGRGSFALSADGRLAASAGGPEPASVWDIQTGKVVYRYPDRMPLLRVVCPDHKTAITLDARLNLEVWNLADGRPLESRPLAIPRRSGWPTGQFSPDGKMIAIYDTVSRAIQVCDVSTGQPIRAAGNWSLTYPTGMGFVPDGKQLVIAAGGRVVLGDTASGRLLRELPGDGLAVGVSPAGRLVAVLDRNQVRLVETATNRVRRTMSVPDVPLDGKDVHFTAGRVRFSRDGSRLAVFGSCYRVWVWRVADGELLFEDRGDRTNLYSDVWPGDLSPDGRWLVYPAADGTGLRLIDLSNPRPGSGTANVSGQSSRITDLTFDPNGTRLVSTTKDGTALVWDVAALIERMQAKPVDYPGVDLLWIALADPDAEDAGQAIEGLVRDPIATVALLREQLQPADAPNPDEVSRLVNALDSSTFAERDGAERTLQELREQVVPALEQALKEPLSAEQRERLRRLRAHADGVETAPNRIQSLRAVEVLERIGSPEARAVLNRLTTGAPLARLTREAKSALQRLNPTGSLLP